MLQNAKGELVTDWNNWPRPKKPEHWKAGRSAMELAKAWFRTGLCRCPGELELLFASDSLTRGLEITGGQPECLTGLIGGGGCRNHDLLLRAKQNGKDIIIGIEAKADERLGNATIGGYWKQKNVIAPGKSTIDESSGVPRRITSLLAILFGPQAQPDALPWSEFRYQLLTGVGGTVVQAAKENAPLAVFVVYEFQTPLTTPRKIEVNHQDYCDFVAELCGVPVNIIQPGRLYSASSILKVPDPKTGSLKAVDLRIGKAVSAIPPSSAAMPLATP